jgi:hypothetical protein
MGRLRAVPRPYRRRARDFQDCGFGRVGLMRVFLFRYSSQPDFFAERRELLQLLIRSSILAVILPSSIYSLALRLMVTGFMFSALYARL